MRSVLLVSPFRKTKPKRAKLKRTRNKKEGGNGGKQVGAIEREQDQMGKKKVRAKSVLRMKKVKLTAAPGVCYRRGLMAALFDPQEKTFVQHRRKNSGLDQCKI